MSDINYSIRWYVGHRVRIDIGCFGSGVREGMPVGGHNEHGTVPVDAIDFC